MYCNKCGGKLNEHDTICSNCGNIIEKENVHQTSNSTGSLGNLYNVETNVVNKNNNQSQVNEVNQVYNKKKKNYWLIPLKLFLAGMACPIVSLIIKLGLYAGENNPISKLFTALYFILLFLVIPSIVYAAIKSNSKSEIEQEIEFNNNINSASNLEEKMIIAYVGNNYEKITTKKFNFAAWLLNIIYIWYRKMYIQGILLFLVLSIIPDFNTTINFILTFIVVILVGFKFNKYYMNYVKKQVQIIKNSNPNSSESDLINICKSKGGTNVFIAIVILIVLSTISSTIYQHFNKIKGEVGDENNGYVLEYSLPSSFEESQNGYDNHNDYTLEAYTSKLDEEKNILCSANFSYIKPGSIMNVDSGEYVDYNSASDYITDWYCEGNATLCDIKSININSNVWYYMEEENEYEKSSIYVHNDKNKLYKVRFSIPNDSSEKQKCSKYKQTIIKSLRFVER